MGLWGLTIVRSYAGVIPFLRLSGPVGVRSSLPILSSGFEPHDIALACAMNDDNVNQLRLFARD